MNTVYQGLLSIVILATVACAGEEAKDPATRDVTAYVYKGECSGSVCPAAPAKSGSEVVECSSEATGQCDWKDGSAAVGSSSDPNSVTSFEACTEKECGPVVDIGCNAGYERIVACGKENGGKCTNYISCVAKPTNELCPESACGPIPELAQVCDPGSKPVTKCSAYKDAPKCRWNFACEGVSSPTK